MANPRRRKLRRNGLRRRRPNPSLRIRRSRRSRGYSRRRNPAIRRARRRNPLRSGILTTVAGAAAGAIGVKAVVGLLPGNLGSGWMGLGLRAAIGYLGGNWIGKATRNESLGEGIVIGALAGVALDAFNSLTGGSASLGEYIQGSFSTPSYPPGLAPGPGGSFNANRPFPIRTALGPMGGM